MKPKKMFDIFYQKEIITIKCSEIAIFPRNLEVIAELKDWELVEVGSNDYDFFFNEMIELNTDKILMLRCKAVMSSDIRTCRICGIPIFKNGCCDNCATESDKMYLKVQNGETGYKYDGQD